MEHTCLSINQHIDFQIHVVHIHNQSSQGPPIPLATTTVVEGFNMFTLICPKKKPTLIRTSSHPLVYNINSILTNLFVNILESSLVSGTSYTFSVHGTTDIS